MIGENVAEHPEIVARAAREGHEIANHSWSHPNLRQDVWTKAFAANSGKPMTQSRTPQASAHTPMRPPYGSITARENAGFTMNSATTSFFGTSIRMTGNVPARLWSELAFLRRRGPARSCYLTTFTRERSRRCLQLLMSSRQKGFKFVTVSELIQNGGGSVPPIRVRNRAETFHRTPLGSPSPTPSPASSPAG